MTQWREFLTRLATQQAGQMQLMLLVPLSILVLLSLLVHTASSAIDPGLEKQKVTEQLKQRLSELQHDPAPAPVVAEAGTAPGVLRSTTPASAEEEATSAQPVPCFPPGGWRVAEGRTGQYFIYNAESRGTEARTGSPARGLGRLSAPQGQSFLRLACPPAMLAAPADTAGTLTTRMAQPWLSREQTSQPSGESFAERVLRLVVAFEHGESTPDEAFGTVVGDYDGQGVSFGLLQWNLGRCTLQPLLRAFQQTDPVRFAQSFAGGTEVIETLLAAPCEESVRLVRHLLLDEEGRVPALWVERFRALGHERVFQVLQLAHLRPVIGQAARLARSLGLQSERAVALCLDIVLQNGGLSHRVRTRYLHDVRQMTRELGRVPTEVERMLIVAHRQAEAATPQWAEAVRTRKVTIACGEGRVNGLSYRLDALGITLRPYQPRS